VIEDDGRGIGDADDTEGLGLLGMRERLELINGKLSIESSEETGTAIVAEVPIS
jgi:signal transduction histidine kinase